MATVRALVFLGLAIATLAVAVVSAQQRPAAPVVPPALTFVPVRPIEPPARPLPPESESANVTRFSFIAYGDTRSAGNPPGTTNPIPIDGDIVHPIHNRIVDVMLANIRALSGTAFSVRFVVQSGDAVLRGANGAQWNVSFTPIIERLTRAGGVPYFFSVGNHDVSGMPAGDPLRMISLHNTLAAMSKLMPPEGSPRRLNGYPTYTFGYGNAFFVAFDSNIASDTLQLAWVTNQLEQLDRRRYRHVIVFFHHPPFSSGPHGGANLEPATAAIRDLYMPLFRKHHIRLILAGHDHLFDHWVERYDDRGASYRLDSIITGGGGAPLYPYSGEPDLQAYLTTGAAQRVRVEHLAKPSPVAADNPHHFVIVQVDGERLSLEIMSIGEKPFTPYNGSARISLSDRAS